MSHTSSVKQPWYKNAVIYALDVSRFFDADGNGVGDFKGLINKLDYFVELGVTCLWLLPFQPSGGKDNGYDITNYIDVDPRLGTLEDFRAFMHEAKTRGLRIILDLVIQHTSHRHPWFIAATGSAAEKYRDYYVWTEQITPQLQAKNSFPTVESGVWQYDEYVKAYYRHQFYSSEPDLNIANPEVQKEIYAIIDFWLAFGVDGFRIDAATHILQNDGIKKTGMKASKYFESLRAFVSGRNAEAILIGEADVDFDDIPEFFGNGNRFQMLYNFLFNNSLFSSLAAHHVQAITASLKRQAKLRTHGTWVHFVRNADELNLERLTPKAQAEAMAVFAPDPNSRIYDRGIRRRLPPMLQGDQHWLRMVYSLLFALPGAAMFVYGEEIGMGDDLALPGRNSVRLPMQWNDGPNGGFSAADEKELVLKANHGEFGFKDINVAQQEVDKTSLLSFFKTMIELRKQHPLIGDGICKIPDFGNKHVLAITYQNHKELVILHNFSDKKQSITFPAAQAGKTYKVLYGEDVIKHAQLSPYGISWLLEQ